MEQQIESLRRHTHDFQRDGRYLMCSCGKKRLATDEDGIGIRADGKKYSIRPNRDRFFYPNEWMKFFDKLYNGKQKITFDILMNTGARINEARHIKVGDIDFERKTLILRVTKVKARKGEKNPRPRTISISSQFTRRLSSYIKENNLNNEDYLGLLTPAASHIALKKTIKDIGVSDWNMFSLHNIRKTHGNYLKALQVTAESEICKRMGHDYNTFLNSYVSADIFSYKDRQEMRLILGDLYQR